MEGAWLWRNASESALANMKPDLIGIVEAAYRDAPSLVAWQTQLLDACSALDVGLGVVIATERMDRVGWKTDRDVVGSVVPALRKAFGDHKVVGDFLASAASASGETRSAIVRAFFQAGARTGSSILGAKAFAKSVGPFLASFGMGDCIGITALLDRSSNFGLYIPLPRIETLSRPTSHRLLLVGAHLAAARRQWQTNTSAEAWVSPTGKILEATSQTRNEMEALSLRARAIEAARTRKGRSEIDSALSLWKGLVAGRWSLIERFDQDGRRYLVAKRNAPDLGNVLRLTESEARILKLCSLGHSQKYVAYTLGFSPATVSTNLSSSMLKLGVRSRAELLGMCGVLFDPATTAREATGATAEP